MSPSIVRKPRFVTITLLAGIFSVLFPLNALCQDDCVAKIQEAQKLYDNGMIEEIPKILSPCMEDGFSRTQKIEAYKLIILSYLFDDNQFEAERTMVEFLKKYPEYEIMPDDPIEFVYLFESYRTTSVFSFGITAGFNLTDPRIIEPYTVFDLASVNRKNSVKPGFIVGLGVGRYLSRKLMLNLEFNFASNSYSFYDEIMIPGNETFTSVTYTERLYKLQMPLSLTYEFASKKIHYYIRGGFSVAKITGITGNPTLEFSDEIPVSGKDQDISYYRQNMLYSGVAGAGVRYKVPRGMVAFDLRANIGLNNIVRSERRFENQEFSTKYYYLDDDFSINTYSFSASYYFSFYKPKKQR